MGSAEKMMVITKATTKLQPILPQESLGLVLLVVDGILAQKEKPLSAQTPPAAGTAGSP